jgi:hypothetical protein
MFTICRQNKPFLVILRKEGNMFNIIKTALGIIFLEFLMIFIFAFIMMNIQIIIPNNIGTIIGIFLGSFASMCVLLLALKYVPDDI